MASGFITLQDGSDWSARWSGYDLVLETIMNGLPDEGESGVLKYWLQYILPDETQGDIESGYCFYKRGKESVLRIIDTRLMKDNYRQLFWQTVSRLNKILPVETNAGYLINQLQHCYDLSLTKDVVLPADQHLSAIFFLGGYEIGI